MHKSLWKFLLVSPVVCGIMLGFGSAKSEEPATSKDAMAQVTSVSQLSDVQPTDWAFQALQSLVERYGCIAGYPGPHGYAGSGFWCSPRACHAPPNPTEPRMCWG